MSNKSRLETNNTNLQTVLQAVQGLPKYVKPEGLYVWKRYQYTPPTYVTSTHNSPSITLTVYSGSGYVATTVGISKSAIDSTISSEEIASFLDGYSFVDGNNATYTFSTTYDGFLELNGKILVPRETDSYWLLSGVSITFPTSKSITMSYPSTTKEVRKISTPAVRIFESFVIGNASDAYPNNEAQGGYWYEKAGDITPLMFGCEKMAIDTVTPSENKKTVSHSLGAVPKIIFFTADALTNAGTIHGMASALPGKDTINGIAIKLVTGYSANTMRVTFTDSALTTTGEPLTAGLTYNIITMA